MREYIGGLALSQAAGWRGWRQLPSSPRRREKFWRNWPFSAIGWFDLSKNLHDPLKRALWTGVAHLLRGDTVAARTALAPALVIIDARLRTSPNVTVPMTSSIWTTALLPDDEELHGDRAYVLAGLGRREEALREIRWLENARRRSRWPGWSHVGELLVLVGETDAALAEIERMLAHPYGMTASWVRVQPVFDGIRSDPRLQRLLLKYANPERR